MAKAHLPPVPPANQPKTPGKAEAHAKDARSQNDAKGEATNQARDINIKQNTTHQGFQQDR